MRLHRGEGRYPHFHRDRSGHEIDLVLPKATELTAVEVKSRQTVTSGLLESRDKFEEAMSRTSPPERVESVLVHGGEEPRVQRGIRVVPWSELPDEPWVV